MKRKPRAMKILQGTDRPDRAHPEPDLPLATDTSPPDWLIDPEAVAEWGRVTELLTPAGVLTPGDLTVLGHMCNMHAHVVACWRSLSEADSALRRPPKAADLTQLRQIYDEFGLTPASRSKVGFVQKAPEVDEFEALKAQ